MKKFLKLLPVLVLVFTVGFAGYSLMTVSAGEDDRIPDTVYIGDIDVSGMTVQEAERALSEYAGSLQNKMITLSTGDKSIQVSAEDLGLEISNLEVVQEAANLGKTGRTKRIWKKSRRD